MTFQVHALILNRGNLALYDSFAKLAYINLREQDEQCDYFKRMVHLKIVD